VLVVREKLGQAIMNSHIDTPQFRIGAVSRRTQIPVDTLRAWERRYEVVTPRRSDSAVRLYSEADVERLLLIKRLVNASHAISSVAQLPSHELQRMADSLEAESANVSTPPVIESIVTFGDAYPPLDADTATRAGLRVIGHYSTWSEFEAAAMANKADALVCQVNGLLPENADAIVRLRRRTRAKRTLVIYGFGQAALVEMLSSQGIAAMRTPTDQGHVVRELTHLYPLERRQIDDEEVIVPDRLLDDAWLTELSALPSVVECECPHHLVDIVRTLAQFEAYSADCESHNAEDAALHARLYATAARARAAFEHAIIDVAEYEGIEIPAGVARALR